MKTLCGEKAKWTNKENDMRMLYLSYTIQVFIQNFTTPGAILPEKSLIKYFIREKEKHGQIKGMINMRMLILSHNTSYELNVCTKFQNLRCSTRISWEIFDRKKFTHTHTPVTCKHSTSCPLSSLNQKWFSALDKQRVFVFSANTQIYSMTKTIKFQFVAYKMTIFVCIFQLWLPWKFHPDTQYDYMYVCISHAKLCTWAIGSLHHCLDKC